MNEDHFFDVCKNKFVSIIKKFNFKVSKQIDEDWGYKLFLQNRTTGIEIYYEFRDMMVFIKLHQLINGKIPIQKGEIRPETILNSFDINDLLEIRSPLSKIPSQKTIDGIDKIVKKIASGKKVKLDEYPQEIQSGDLSIDNILSKHADNLERYAEDILEGDFSLFVDLNKIVKDRAKKIAIQKWGERAKEFGWDV